ncbi:neuropeptide Y receptor type 5-like [Oppia nitens]|uniref:neuropeptide Y receptor type 5-like n=1 Tax=Oppia nitens TaxID=1686743 RepID=UPI0023D98319|nr:neuropeptide Y receptor type 5-like [Oppia nitens]
MSQSVHNLSYLCDNETVDLKHYLSMNLTIHEIIKLVCLEDEIPDEFTENTIIITVYTMIIMISLFGNLFVLKVTFNLRTTTNLLIASLSISDLIVTLFSIPFNVSRLIMDEWPFGQFMCFMVPFLQIMAVYVSSFTMAVIAIYRWRSVSSVVPVQSWSRLYLLATIIGTWILSAIMAIPLSMFNKIQIVESYKPVTRCRNLYPDSRHNISLMLTIEVFLTQYVIPLSCAGIIVSI